MEEVKTVLKNLINKEIDQNRIFKRNILKEYLQILVLDFIYSHPKYSQMVFYGGSCLSHCYGLPRLSEDLDFVDLKKRVNISSLAKDLKSYFEKNTDLSPAFTIQKFRIYLKFSLLHELKLSERNETNWLFLKIEIFKEFDFCKIHKTETIPLFKFNKSILIRVFDLSTLMSTKIRAVLYRKWEKTDKKGKILAKVKGRDYFDLMWYLKEGIKPNMKCLEEISKRDELKKKLLKIVKRIDYKSIQLDLESLIADQNFVKNLSKNIKGILESEIEKKL